MFPIPPMVRRPYGVARLVVGLALSIAPQAVAADYYVSTAGSDGAGGSIAAPWRTVGKAVATAVAGDTVWVRGGVYAERVTLSRSGTAAARIVYRNYPDEVPVLEGAGMAVGGTTAMVRIDGADYVTLQGFEVRNLTTSNSGSTPTGIRVTAAAIGVEVLDCHIHHIENNHAGGDGNAHGILVSGTQSTAISGLSIRGCLVEDLKLGNSEALVLNGNVDGFEVRENTVRRCNNIGIDFIGHEGTNANAALDQARNGVCADNLVYECSSLANPAYFEYSAGGIYVDGGRDIIIERNSVYACDIGVEIAAEAPGKATSGVTVRDNLIWRNSIGGIYTGGYSSGRGSTEDCVISGNTLYQNDTQHFGNGELYIRWKTYGLEVGGNIFYANSQNLLIANITSDIADVSIDYNVLNAPFGGEFQWHGGAWFSGFNNWKSRTGHDANSKFANPGFASTAGSPGGFDFRFESSSPAYNAGDPGFVPKDSQRDAYGNERLTAGRVDAGAFELPVLTALEAWRLEHFGGTKGEGDAADLADPDFDGSPNLQEFAFGTNPLSGTGGVLEVASAGQFRFTRAAMAAAEVRYEVQALDPEGAVKEWEAIAERPAGAGWTTAAGVTVSELGGTVVVDDARALEGVRLYRVQVGL